MRLRRLPMRQTVRAFNDVDTQGTWIITYGDLVTLLLVFFILFFWVNKDKITQKALDASLLATLEPLKTDTDQLGSQDIAEQLKELKGLEGDIDNTMNGKGDYKDKLTAQWGASIIQSGNRVIVTFPNLSFFGLGKIDVNSAGKIQLEKFTKTYLPFAGRYALGIRAYTDTTPVSANNPRYKDNLQLSALRSVSAMRILQKSGIPLNRMRLGGYGELKQAAKDLSIAENKKQKNLKSLARKIVLVIEPDEGEKI